MQFRFLFCSVIATVAIAAGPSEAQFAAGADTQPAIELARQHHVEGDTRYANGDYGGAHAAYAAAWRLNKHYQIAGNLGDCEIKLGKYRDAAEHLAYFIREYPRDKPVDRLNEGKKLFEVARSQIGALSVVVDGPAADVFVDGHSMGRSPLYEPLYLDPGTRLIEARSGFGTSRATVAVIPGLTDTVTLKLAAAPGPVVRKPKAAWKKRLVPLLATAGGSLVSIGTGIGFAAASNGKADEREALKGKIEDRNRSSCVDPSDHNRQYCLQIADSHTESKTFQALSITSFVLGGLAAARTAAIVLWPEKSPRSPRVEANPVVGPGGVALGLKGQF